MAVVACLPMLTPDSAQILCIELANLQQVCLLLSPNPSENDSHSSSRIRRSLP